MPVFPPSYASKEIVKQALTEQGYTSARAANLDKLDATVSSRAAPADILVDPSVKIDASKINDNLDAAVSSRAAPSDILADPTYKVDAKNLLYAQSPIEGTATPSDLDVETTVVDVNPGVPAYLEGYIDASALESGDTVVVKWYVKIQSGGDYLLIDQQSYDGPLDNPVIYVITAPATYGLKITITQTAGTVKSFPYQFFLRKTQ